MKEITEPIADNLPWALSAEEFRRTGNFVDWEDESVRLAISTLVSMTIVAYHRQKR
jgi:hypothetical protein